MIGILLLTTQLCYAGRGEKRYPVSAIDPELLKNADAVVRLSEKTFTIEQMDRSVYRIHQVITIFNKKAKDEAMVYMFYDKLSKITDFEADVYNEYGEEMTRLKKSDIRDESFINGFSLYEDNRVQYADMGQVNYPYTVDYTVEIRFNSLFSIPDVWAMDAENLAIENSTYTLISPPDLYPRFRAHNYEGKPVEKQEGSLKYATWTFKNLKALEGEVLGKGLREMTAWIEISPTRFEYDGYAGNMSSWDEFARWIASLQKDRDQLPAATVQKIRELTAGMTKEEKVAAVYHYVQERTRYVSIQLGIGGFQPFEAGLVDEVGYGDCKALSNYTKALLKAAGVPAYYTLVFAGDSRKPIDSDFAVNAFNHVIVCVPDEKDTIWLECTSQTNPFGYMGTFTGDRDVLMVTDNGGKIVHTPVYREKDNLRARKATVTFNKEGQAEATVTTNYRGLQYETKGLYGYINLGDKDKKDWIHATTEIPSYELMGFDFQNKKAKIPEAEVEITLWLPNYASASGKRFYFEPNLLSKLSVNLPSYEHRKTKFTITGGYTKVDTMQYTFPSEYQSEFLPEPAAITSAFGSYHTSCTFIQGKLIYTRELIVHSGEYEPEQYANYLEFLHQVAKEDKKKVVFTTKT